MNFITYIVIIVIYGGWSKHLKSLEISNTKATLAHSILIGFDNAIQQIINVFFCIFCWLECIGHSYAIVAILYFWEMSGFESRELS
jgi:hypothetical protein